MGTELPTWGIMRKKTQQFFFQCDAYTRVTSESSPKMEVKVIGCKKKKDFHAMFEHLTCITKKNTGVANELAGQDDLGENTKRSDNGNKLQRKTGRRSFKDPTYQ